MFIARSGPQSKVPVGATYISLLRSSNSRTRRGSISISCLAARGTLTVNCPNYHYTIHDEAGKLTHHRPMRIATNLPGILWLIGASLLLIVSASGEVVESARAATSDPCSKTILHCKSYGSGDPIIALHGLGGTLYSWHKLEDKFPNHQLILLDLKGAGDSPKPHDKHYSIRDQTDLILKLIHDNDLKNLTLMGNSYGGAVALFLAIELCKEKPLRLASLILIDSGGSDQDLPSHLTILRTPLVGWLVLHLLSPRAQVRRVLRDSYYDRKKITGDQIDAYAKGIASPGGRYALLQTARQAIPKDIKEIMKQYKTISVPTLIIWGLNDRIIPLKTGKMLHREICGSTLELINNCGHVPQEEQPEETMRYITQFFGRMGQRP
jgi:pimeloyl-ACP methyl ester carboxylesterase